MFETENVVKLKRIVVKTNHITFEIEQPRYILIYAMQIIVYDTYLRKFKDVRNMLFLYSDKNWVHFFQYRISINLDHFCNDRFSIWIIYLLRESSFFIGNRFPRSPQTRRHISVMQLFCQSHNFSIDFLKLLSPHIIYRELCGSNAQKTNKFFKLTSNITKLDRSVKRFQTLSISDWIEPRRDSFSNCDPFVAFSIW